MKKGKIAFGAALLFCIVCLIASLHTHVFAQPASTGPAAAPDNLTEAMVLLSQGKPSQAGTLIAAIPSSDPDYPAAQCYKAVCYYELTNYPAFLKQMQSPAIQQASIDPEIMEDLNFKYVEVLFKYRKFEQIIPQIDFFQTNYPASSRLSAVAEYQLAASFERGLKKALESGSLTNQNQLNERESEAKTNLTQFLSLAASFPGANYSYLTNRVLKENVWLARIALGQDQAALAAIPTQDTADRERFSFLRIGLWVKWHRDQLDQNIALMTNYLQNYSAPDDRMSVENQMGEFSFRKGKQLIVAAAASELAQDTNTAQAQLASAGQYFELMQSAYGQVVTNQAAGLEESDIIDTHEDMFYSYCLEKNYRGLMAAASAMIAQSTPGGLDWANAKLYTGIALASPTLHQMTAAAPVLDEVLALGFKNKPDQDHFVLFAAKWRIYVAEETGDHEKAVQLVQWVNGSNCTKNYKADFLKIYGKIAGL